MTRAPYAAIAAILLSVLALIAGNALHNTLVPLRGKLEGFPSLTLGLIASSFFAGMLAGTLLGPAIIRHVGHVKAYAIFAAIAIMVAVAYPLSVSPGSWLVLRALVGFAFAGLYGVIDGWVQGKAENEHRGQLGGAYQTVHFVAVACGQMLLPVADPMGFQLFILVGMLFAASIIPFSLSRTEPPALPETAKLELGWLFRNAQASAVAALAIGAANGSFWSLSPVYASANGMSTTEIATFLTATILGSAVAVMPIGRYSDSHDRRLVMAAMMGVACVLELALFIVGRLPGYGMPVAGFMIGTVVMTLYSVASAHANDRSDAGQAVTIASSLLFLYSVGAILGPLAASWAMDRIGPQGLFLFMAVIHAIALSVAVMRMRTRAPAMRRETETKVPPTGG
jgi:MFS family permease